MTTLDVAAAAAAAAMPDGTTLVVVSLVQLRCFCKQPAVLLRVTASTPPTWVGV